MNLEALIKYIAADITDTSKAGSGACSRYPGKGAGNDTGIP